MDVGVVRDLKLIMDNGVGANPGGFPTLDTSSKKMRAAKDELKKITFAEGHPLQRQRVFSDALAVAPERGLRDATLGPMDLEYYVPAARHAKVRAREHLLSFRLGPRSGAPAHWCC